MHLSSILVYAHPEFFNQAYAQLSAFPFLKVYYQCENSGRMVLIQQHDSTEEQIKGLNKIKTVDHVISADLIYHFVEPDDNFVKTAVGA